ncbi:MAG: hypothetical protein EOO66_30020, partial [Methylobacterium sp.]
MHLDAGGIKHQADFRAVRLATPRVQRGEAPASIAAVRDHHSFKDNAMKTRAAVAWEAKKPLTIETIDIEGPKAGEV